MIRLGSNSPTRAKMLQDRGIKFIQSGSDFDEEQITTKEPRDFVYTATMGKYLDCLEKYGVEIPLLVADTVVTADNKILRKAKDKDDAKKILLTQSGNSVSIITCMIFKSKDDELIDISQTEYLFETFDDKDLENYLKGDEWQGKAGACMVEGFCKKYIKEVKGLESTAMGLTVEKIIPYLKKTNP